MTFAHSALNYIFENWRTATKSSDEALRAGAVAALAIGNLTGTDLRHQPDIDEGLRWLIQGAVMGSSDFQSVVKRFHDAYKHSVPTNIQSLLVPWLVAAAAHGSYRAREDLVALGENVALMDALERLRTQYCGIGQPRFGEGDDHLSPASLESLIQNMAAKKRILNEWHDTLLHAVAVTRRGDLVERLLEQGHNVNAVNKDNETPLLYAARCGNSAMVQILLSKGASSIILNARGESALHYLTAFHEPEIPVIAKLLVTGSIDLEAMAESPDFSDFLDDSIHHGTALHFAVERNHLGAVKALLEHGADLYLKPHFDDIPSPIALAAQLHYPEILSHMLQHLRSKGVSAQRITIDRATGNSLLIYAIGGSGFGISVFQKISRNGARWRQRALDTLDVLLEAGANDHFASLPGLPYCTAVFFAIQSDAHIVDAILKVDRRSINQPARILESDEDRPPLFEAILYHRFEVFDVLLKYKVDLMTRLEYEGDPITALYYCAFSRHERMDMVDAILKAGVEVDDSPSGVETPFICAVRNRAFRLARHLLTNNAYANTLFDRGIFITHEVPKTLLGCLIEETSPAMLGCLNFLLENVHDLKFATTANDDWTILHDIAALDFWTTHDLKDPTIGEVLRCVKNYFRPTKEQINKQTYFQDNNGMTALHLAAIFGNYVVADWLVENGADTSLLERNGLTAADIAYMRAESTFEEDILDIPTAAWRQKDEANTVRNKVFNCIVEHTPAGVNKQAVARYKITEKVSQLSSDEQRDLLSHLEGND